MKNRYGYIFMLLCFNAIAMTSCIKEEWGVGNVQQVKNEEGGGWNKNKTFEVYYLTELQNRSLKDISAVSGFFKRKGNACSLGIVDRTDAGATNPTTQIAFETAHFSSFALNKMTGGEGSTKFEGTTILFNHKINSEESFRVADDCYVKYMNIQTTTTTTDPIHILVPFSTVRFDSKKQIEAAKPVLKTLSDTMYGALVIGTVKTDLLAELESAAKDIPDYTMTVVTKNAETEYSIFMLGQKAWVLREMTRTPVDGNLNAFCLSVEASVE